MKHRFKLKMEKTRMKVKELKELLANVDDELEIVGYKNWSMERSGLMPVGKWDMKVISVKMVKKKTWDRFETGTDYTYEAFEEDENGDMKVFRLY